MNKTIEQNPSQHPGISGKSIVTSKELWMQQAASLNFEHDEVSCLALALERGFVTKIEGSEDQFLVNENYKGKNR